MVSIRDVLCFKAISCSVSWYFRKLLVFGGRRKTFKPSICAGRAASLRMTTPLVNF